MQGPQQSSALTLGTVPKGHTGGASGQMTRLRSQLRLITHSPRRQVTSSASMPSVAHESSCSQEKLQSTSLSTCSAPQPQQSLTSRQSEGFSHSGGPSATLAIPPLAAFRPGLPPVALVPPLAEPPFPLVAPTPPEGPTVSVPPINVPPTPPETPTAPVPPRAVPPTLRSSLDASSLPMDIDLPAQPKASSAIPPATRAGNCQRRCREDRRKPTGAIYHDLNAREEWVARSELSLERNGVDSSSG